MRHRATRRHARYAGKPGARAYVTALLSAVALLAVSLAFGSARAQVTTARATVQLAADTGAAAAIAADKAAVARSHLALLPAGKAAAAALDYTVEPGDTLSRVAQERCGAARDWTGIYQASRAWRMTARNANVLAIGQRLRIFCVYEPSMLSAAQAPRAALAVSYQGDSDGTSASQPAVYQAPAQAPATYQGSGSMQQCIIARESGGNSQVMNSTGHYGLYQFSASTWAAHGGNPADFGNASVAEQNQVYYNTVAADGYSDWAPYDGC